MIHCNCQRLFYITQVNDAFHTRWLDRERLAITIRLQAAEEKKWRVKNLIYDHFWHIYRNKLFFFDVCLLFTKTVHRSAWSRIEADISVPSCENIRCSTIERSTRYTWNVSHDQIRSRRQIRKPEPQIFPRNCYMTPDRSK